MKSIYAEIRKIHFLRVFFSQKKGEKPESLMALIMILVLFIHAVLPVNSFAAGTGKISTLCRRQNRQSLAKTKLQKLALQHIYERRRNECFLGEAGGDRDILH